MKFVDIDEYSSKFCIDLTAHFPLYRALSNCGFGKNVKEYDIVFYKNDKCEDNIT